MASESFGTEMYEMAMASQRLPMYSKDWVNFYFRPLLRMILYALMFFGLPLVGLRHFTVSEHLVVSAFGVFWIGTEVFQIRQQFKGLGFDFVKRTSTVDLKRQIILQLQKDYKWQLLRSDRQAFRFLWIKRWQRVTILVNDQGYYVNCVSVAYKPQTERSVDRNLVEVLEEIRKRDRVRP